jgi:hypothetical protein
VAAGGVDGVFDDGEAKAGAAVGAAAGAVDGVEAFEDAFLVFEGDAAAGVLDFQHEELGVGSLVGADGDAAGLGEFDGVVDEIFEHEHEEALVAAEGLGVLGQFNFDRDMLFGGHGGEEAHGHLAGEAEIDAVDADHGARVFGAREIKEILHHHLQPEGVIVDDVDAAACGFLILHAGFLDGFDGGADGGERGAEFVAGVGDEVGFHLEGAGDVGDIAHQEEGAAVVGAVVDGGGGGLAVDGAAGDLEGDLGGDGLVDGEGVAVEGHQVGVVDDGLDMFADQLFSGAFEDSCGGGIGEADGVHVVGGEGDFVALIHDGKEGEEVIFVLLGAEGAGFEGFGEGVGGEREFAAAAGEVGIGAARKIALGQVGDEVQDAGDAGTLHAEGIEESAQHGEQGDTDQNKHRHNHAGSVSAKSKIDRGSFSRTGRLLERFLFFLEQAVADAADGVDHPGEIAELFANGGDVDVDGAISDEDIGAHGAIHELIAGEHAATEGEDGGEEFEFGGGEVDAAALDGDLVLALIDHHGSGGEERHGGFHGGFSPQDRSDAGHEDFHGEGFGHVVVRAEGEADDDVGFFSLGGEHDDGEGGGFGIGFEGAGDVLAGEAGHHHIEDDEIGFLLAGHVETGGAVIGGDDFVAVALEVHADEFDEVALIVHDQDFFPSGH